MTDRYEDLSDTHDLLFGPNQYGNSNEKFHFYTFKVLVNLSLGI